MQGNNILNQNNKGYNWLALLIMLIMMSISIISLYAIDYNQNKDFWSNFFSIKTLMGRQAFWIGISLLLFVVIHIIDVKVFTYFAFYYYYIGIAILILTLFVGSYVKGTRSFISFGNVSVQPAELFKTFVAMALAKFLGNYNIKVSINRWKAWGIILLPIIIILAQSEMGQAIVYMSLIIPLYREGFAVWMIGLFFVFIVLFIAALFIHPIVYIIVFSVGLLILFFILSRKRKTKKRKIFLIICIAFLGIMALEKVIVPFTINHVLKNYQIKRIYATWGPDVLEEYQTEWMTQKTLDIISNAKKTNYNVNQSKIAIGSGGVTGQGYLRGTQTTLKFVPEQKNDFIFSTIGENFGFVGCLVYILLAILLLFQIIRIAENQRSQLSRAYAYGVFAIIFCHIIINISVTIGLFPVMGITLPWISYGGTSILSFTTMMAILLKLDMYKKAAIK